MGNGVVAALRTLWKAVLRLGSREPLLLVMAALAASALWAFVELADEVMEGETRAIDRAILLAMRTPGDPSDPVGPAWFEELMRDFTALGGIGVSSLLVAAACGFLLLRRKRRTALLLFVATSGGVLLSLLLKIGFERPRPDLVSHGSLVYTASFPSGHSTIAAVVFLTIGALLARMQPNPVLKIYILSLAGLATVLVGISRIYLGVHWPTDVLAGWAIGSAWALLTWLVALYLQTRSRIERDG